MRSAGFRFKQQLAFEVLSIIIHVIIAVDSLFTSMTIPQCYAHPPQYYGQNHQPIAKIESNTHDHFSFFIRKNNKPTTSIGQHSRRKWFSEEEETSLLGKNKNKSMIIHKKTKLATSNKTDDHDQQKLQ